MEGMVKLLRWVSTITTLRIIGEHTTTMKKAIASRERKVKKVLEDYNVKHLNILSKVDREHNMYQDLVDQCKEVQKKYLDQSDAREERLALLEAPDNPCL